MKKKLYSNNQKNKMERYTIITLSQYFAYDALLQKVGTLLLIYNLLIFSFKIHKK